MLVSISPKMSVSSFMKYFVDCNAIIATRSTISEKITIIIYTV